MKGISNKFWSIKRCHVVREDDIQLFQKRAQADREAHKRTMATSIPWRAIRCKYVS